MPFEDQSRHNLIHSEKHTMLHLILDGNWWKYIFLALIKILSKLWNDQLTFWGPYSCLTAIIYSLIASSFFYSKTNKFWSKEKCWCQTVSAFAHQQVLIKSDIAKMGAWDSFFREWENMLLEQYLKCKTLTRKPKGKILICWKSAIIHQ